MTLDSWIALFSTIGICAGTVFVGLQLKVSNEQQKLANEQQKIANDQSKLESAYKFFTTNREILALGFANPELFQILHGIKGDPIIERPYLQLWFNHFAMVYAFWKKDAFLPELCESFEVDVSFFMEEQNAQDHWKQNRSYYSAGFQSFIDSCIPSKKTDALEERPSQEGIPLTDS